MSDGLCVCDRFQWSMISIEPDVIIVKHTPHFPNLTDPIWLFRGDLPAGLRVENFLYGFWVELETPRQAVCFVDQWLVADHFKREGVELALP